MISLVTVAYKKTTSDDLVEIFIKSVAEMASLIKEVIIVHGRAETSFIHERQIKGITVKNIAPQPYTIKYNSKEKAVYHEHSLAMHFGINQITQPYLLMSDPDVIFYKKKFDEYYLNLYEKYNLNIIGVSHYHPSDQPFYFNFPTIINCLIKKDKLPPQNWLKGLLKLRPILKGCDYKNNGPIMDGCFLLGGGIPQKCKEFPNRDCFFNPGCNLWLWDKENGKKFITFQCIPNGLEYWCEKVKISHGINNFNPADLHTGVLLRHTKGWSRPYDNKLHVMKDWFLKSKRFKLFI